MFTSFYIHKIDFILGSALSRIYHKGRERYHFKLLYKQSYDSQLFFCISFNTQLTNLKRKRTGQRRKSLQKFEPVQARKQRKEQTTRLNRRKMKREPWRRMTLAKAMKIMMMEKTRKRHQGYKSLEDSKAVSKEFFALVVVQWQSRRRYFRRKSSVQLDALK